MKNRWKQMLMLVLAAGVIAGLTGCSAESKRKRHLKRADAYYQKNELQKAEIEYLGAAKFSKSPDPLIVGRLASIYHAQGRTFEAYPALMKAKELNADDLEIRYRLGTVMVALQRFGPAREEAFFILGKKPDHPGALMLLADTSQSPETNAATRAKLQSLIQSGANTWAAHAALASLYLRDKNMAAAELEVQEAAKLNPQAPEVKLLQARIAASQNQGEKSWALLRSAMETAPAHSPIKLQFAIAKMQAGDMATTKKVLDDLLKETPDDTPTWILRGKVALAENDFAECERIADRVLTWNPRSYDIRLLRARAWLLQGKKSEALTEFGQLDAMYPKTPEIKYETAVAHVQNGAGSEALKSLDEALQLSPGYVPAILLRAQLKLRMGGVAETITAMLAFLKADPSSVQAKMILASAYKAMGQMDQALSLYAELSKQFPRHPELLAYQGFIHGLQGRPEQARKLYEDALKISPHYFPATEELIDMDLKEKKMVEAQKRADDLLVLHTNAPGAKMIAAKVALAKGETNNATRLLREVSEKMPEASGLYVLLAQIEMASGNNKNAVEHFKQAVERNPKSPAANLQLGMAYDAEADYANARKQYELVVKLNPRVAPAWNNLAYLLSERFNELEPAAVAASKARELLPSDPEVADTLGWIHFRKGEFPQALSLLREAAVLRPTVAEVIYHLARVEYVMGQEDAARASFQKVLTLKGRPSLLKDAEQRLAVLSAAPGASSVATLEAAVKTEPGDYLAVYRLGQAYEAAGNFDKAVASFETATKLNPTVAAPLVKAAVLYADKLGNAPKGLEAAKAARKIAPNDPVVAGVLGRLSYRNGDFASATALLQENIRSSSPDAELLYDLGMAFYCVGQFEQSRGAVSDYLRGASASRGSEARDFQRLLDFAEGKGEVEAAQKAAALRTARDANDLPGLMTTALSLEKSGKLKEAVSGYEKVLALNKSFVLAQRHLAILYADSVGNDDKVIELATKARQAFPRDAALAKAQGKAAYRKGDHRLAVSALVQATSQPPADAEALYLLGLSYEKTQKLTEAREAFNSVMTTAPTSTFAAQAKEALQRLK
jgi:tetratricopeptide (TPR) repeat protein